MDECIKLLKEATVSLTLEAFSGYFHEHIERKDNDKTAFTSHHGLGCFVSILFGLKNAPRTVPRIMYVLLASVNRQYALIDLEDIAIFSKTLERPIKHVWHVHALR